VCTHLEVNPPYGPSRLADSHIVFTFWSVQDTQASRFHTTRQLADPKFVDVQRAYVLKNVKVTWHQQRRE